MIEEEFDAEEFEEEEEIDDEEVEEQKEEKKEPVLVPDTFCVHSLGVSINGTGFCRGTYRLGQLVGTLTINEDIRDNI